MCASSLILFWPLWQNIWFKLHPDKINPGPFLSNLVNYKEKLKILSVRSCHNRYAKEGFCPRLTDTPDPRVDNLHTCSSAPAISSSATLSLHSCEPDNNDSLFADPLSPCAHLPWLLVITWLLLIPALNRGNRIPRFAQILSQLVPLVLIAWAASATKHEVFWCSFSSESHPVCGRPTTAVYRTERQGLNPWTGNVTLHDGSGSCADFRQISSNEGQELFWIWCWFIRTQLYP